MIVQSVAGPASDAGDADGALRRLLARLQRAEYEFIAPTPATHRLVAARRECARPGDLRDIFGWGRIFGASDLDPALLADLVEADGVRREGDRLASRYRVSTLEGRLHLHSARSGDPDAVFFGPDSYRFVRFLAKVLETGSAWRRAVDIGAGAGAGALALAARRKTAEVVAVDINPQALRLLAINADQAGLRVIPVFGDGPAAASGVFDLIVANPPYIAGKGGRIYRDGGDRHGAELALAWVEQAQDRLAPEGRMVLYTGAPVIEGRDIVRDALSDLAAQTGLDLAYEEIDPDVFGGSLGAPAYADVERIAAIGAVLSR